MSMETNLKNAILELNDSNQPFEYKIKGDEVIGVWKWMDLRNYLGIMGINLYK